MKYTLNWTASAVGILGLFLSAPASAWAAADSCVAAQNAPTPQAAFKFVIAGSPGSIALEGNSRVDWTAAGECRFSRMFGGNSMSYACKEEHYTAAMVKICQERVAQAKKQATDIQNQAAQLANKLSNWAMSPELVREYQDFTAGSAPDPLKKQVDEAFEKGLVGYMGERRFKAGGKEPPADQLDQAAYAAWLKRQNAADKDGLEAKRKVLEARALKVEAVLRMNEASDQRRKEAERHSARIAAEDKKAADAKAAKESECKFWRDMMSENQCGARSMLSVCTKPALEIARLGC